MNKLNNLSPKKAEQKINTNPQIFLIDVRCEAENKFVGRPLNCYLVPWIDEPEWETNPKLFIKTIKTLLTKNNGNIDSEIILICRSGYRSADAGKYLINNGFTNISHIITGFEGDLDENNQRGNLNGWRFDGLNWEQC